MESKRRLSEAVEGYRVDRCHSRLWSRLGEASELTPPQRARAELILGEAALELREDIVSREGSLEPATSALLEQLGEVRAVARFARARSRRVEALVPEDGDGLRLSGRLRRLPALVSTAARTAELGSLMRDLRPVGQDQAWLAARLPTALRDEQVAAPLSESWAPVLGGLLEQSAAPFLEIAEYLSRPHGARGALSPQALLCALSGDVFAGLLRDEGRLRRAGAPFRELGYERAMGHALRPAADAISPSPEFEPEVEGVTRFHVVQASCGAFALAELAARSAVATGLLASLSSVELPWSLRMPAVVDSTSTLGGALFAQLGADRRFVARHYGLSGRDLERARRQLLLALLVRVRVDWAVSAWVAEVQGAATGGGGVTEELAERAAEAVGRAVGLDPAPGLVGWLVGDPLALLERAKAHGRALSLHAALRDRFDEDYFRNPRFGEWWTAVGLQGARLSADALCDELGASKELAAERLLELVQG